MNTEDDDDLLFVRNTDGPIIREANSDLASVKWTMTARSLTLLYKPKARKYHQNY
jgi:hypothetical protein